MNDKPRRLRLKAKLVTRSTGRTDKMTVADSFGKPAIKRLGCEYDKKSEIKPPMNIGKRLYLDLKNAVGLIPKRTKEHGFVSEKELRERKREIYGNDAPDINTTKGNASKFSSKRENATLSRKGKIGTLRVTDLNKLANSGKYKVRDKITGQIIGSTNGTGNKIW